MSDTNEKFAELREYLTNPDGAVDTFRLLNDWKDPDSFGLATDYVAGHIDSFNVPTPYSAVQIRRLLNNCPDDVEQIIDSYFSHHDCNLEEHLINAGLWITEENEFYSGNIGHAREDVEKATKDSGLIVSMPLAIAIKSRAVNVDGSRIQDHYLWNHYISTSTDEYYLTDKEGKLGKKGQEIVINLHGGGILTASRIKQACNEGLINGIVRLTPDEAENLLQGILPNGKTIELYHAEDVAKGIKNRFGNIGTWLSRELMGSSGYHQKDAFLSNLFVNSRTAETKEGLEPYFNAAQHESYHYVGNHYRNNINFEIPQGYVLHLFNAYNGLDGGYFYDYGRFVGVGLEETSRNP